MKLEGTHIFNAPREQVWEALLDPHILANVMPGCEKLDKVGDNVYAGIMQIRMGTLSGTFKGEITLSDLQAPESYTMSMKGHGSLGNVTGSGVITLEAQEEQTLMHYSGDAQVAGRITSVGQRLMDRSAKALTQQSLDGLSQQIEARQKAEETGEPVQVIMPPSQAEFATGVVKNMLSDLQKDMGQEQWIKLGVGLFGVYLVVRMVGNWFADLVAKRVVKQLNRQNRRARK